MMADAKHKKNDFEELIAESRRIREELIRTAGRLDGFVAQLAAEAEKLRNITGEAQE
jgi:hypothetical protein